MDMVIITIFLLIINNFISQRNTYNTSSKRLKSSRSSHPEVFLGKRVWKICSKFTGEHPCRSTLSIKLLCNFIEIALRYGCSPVNLLHIFRTPFLKNTSERLLLEQQFWKFYVINIYFFYENNHNFAFIHLLEFSCSV